MILQKIPVPEYVNPESVASLIRYSWIVKEPATIGALAEEWKERMDIPVVAILGPQGTLRGVLSYTHLYSVLGRPYGWDVFKKKSVAELLEQVQAFLGDEPLLLITERLAMPTGSPARSYYAVEDSMSRFQGLFAQQDLVDYLSKSTFRDLALAKSLQNQLVKREWEIREAGIWAHGICEMFRGVGGDFSTIRSTRPGNWFGCVCDVSGKGIAASLVTTLLWGVLEVLDLTTSLEYIIKKVNSAVFKAFQSEKFVSGFFWTFDSADGHLVFADMGHSHQFLWAAGVLEAFQDSLNIPLGIDESVEIILGERWLKPGDGILAYSDGVVENVWAPNHDFPLEGLLREILDTNFDVPALKVLHEIRAALRVFRQTFPAHDDVSMVWFQRT